MKGLWLLAAFLLVSSVSNAALTNWSVDISINDDGGTDWTAVLTYNSTVTRSDYFVLSRITNVQVSGDGAPLECVSTYSLGTSIVCDGIAAREVVYKFNVKALVSDLQNFKLFRYPFSVTETVDRMQITVKFPLGAALVEDLKLGGTGLSKFEPDFGREGTDGRRIFVTWVYDKPILGQSINIYAIYEVLGIDPFMIFVVILALVIIAFLITIMFIFRKQRVKDLLPVLTDGERKVMEILPREKGEVDQRTIVRETDFSKPKVSRVINDLIDRGLVDKISKGRKNLIKLKKEVKRADSRDAKSKEQK